MQRSGPHSRVDEVCGARFHCFLPLSLSSLSWVAGAGPPRRAFLKVPPLPYSVTVSADSSSMSHSLLKPACDFLLTLAGCRAAACCVSPHGWRDAAGCEPSPPTPPPSQATAQFQTGAHSLLEQEPSP